MFFAFLGLVLFIIILLVASNTAQKRGNPNGFAFFAGALAILGFLSPLAIGLRVLSKQNLMELVVSLVALLILLPVMWKASRRMEREKNHKS